MVKKGKVKFFDEAKEFGFIIYAKGKEIYFNITSVKNNVVLKKGDSVIFDMRKNKKGFYVINVRKQRYRYYLPKDTSSVLKNKVEISNLNLKFNKYIKDLEKQKINMVIDIAKTFDFKNLSEQITQINNSIKQLDLDFIKEGDEIGFSLELDSRLAIGLGNPSVFETSMTLHHIYGVPYIPGSALKGVCRNYFLSTVMERCFPKLEWKRITDLEKVCSGEKPKDDIEVDQEIIKAFQYLFGTQKQQGAVTFFDAFPEGGVTLKADIITPHYGDYYKGKNNSPADYESPIPIPFLTVEETSFKFLVGEQKGKNWPIEKDMISILKGSLSETIKTLITEALTNQGIGAKTAVGYGYFEASKNSENQ